MKMYRVYTTLDTIGKTDRNVPKFVKAYNRDEAWEKAKALCVGKTVFNNIPVNYEPKYLQYFHLR